MSALCVLSTRRILIFCSISGVYQCLIRDRVWGCALFCPLKSLSFNKRWRAKGERKMKNKGLICGVAIAIFLQIAMLCVVLNKTGSAKESIIKSLLPEFHKAAQELKNEGISEFKTVLQGLSEKYGKMADETSEVISKGNNAIQVATNEYAAILDTFRVALSKQQDSMLADINDVLIKNIRMRNESVANEALLMARKALEVGNDDMAKMYLLNALNHNPASSKHLLEYYRFCKENETTNINSFEQLRNIIETVIYQLNPSEVARVLKLHAEVTKDIEKLVLNEQKKSMAENGEKIKGAEARLANGDLSWESIVQPGKDIDLNALQNRIEVIEEISAIKGGGDRLLEISLRSASLLRIVDAIEQTLRKANSNLSSGELNAVGSKIEAARNYLPSIWSMDLNGIPEIIISRAKQAETIVVSTEESYFQKKSLKPSQKILETVKRAKEIEARKSTYSERINSVASELQTAQKLLVEIYDSNLRSQGEFEIQKINKILNDLIQARMTEYNKWAINQCKKAFDMWKECDSKIATTSEEAATIASLCLAEIDARLLIPAALDLYGDIYNAKVTPKLSVQQRVDFALKAKKGLDDL